MRTMLLFTAFLSLTSYGKIDRTDYLHKVLRNLERIETVSFRVRNESYMPGDTIPALQEKRYESFACPADTTLGVKFLVFDAADTLQPSFGYDGTRKAYFDHNEKIIQTDDFTTLSLPFRPVTAPFFSRAESILRYALTTSDRSKSGWTMRTTRCTSGSRSTKSIRSNFSAVPTTCRNNR